MDWIWPGGSRVEVPAPTVDWRAAVDRLAEIEAVVDGIYNPSFTKFQQYLRKRANAGRQLNGNRRGAPRFLKRQLLGRTFNRKPRRSFRRSFTRRPTLRRRRYPIRRRYRRR